MSRDIALISHSFEEAVANLAAAEELLSEKKKLYASLPAELRRLKVQVDNLRKAHDTLHAELLRAQPKEAAVAAPASMPLGLSASP